MPLNFKMNLFFSLLPIRLGMIRTEGLGCHDDHWGCFSAKLINYLKKKRRKEIERKRTKRTKKLTLQFKI